MQPLKGICAIRRISKQESRPRRPLRPHLACLGSVALAKRPNEDRHRRDDHCARGVEGNRGVVAEDEDVEHGRAREAQRDHRHDPGSGAGAHHRCSPTQVRTASDTSYSTPSTVKVDSRSGSDGSEMETGMISSRLKP